MIPNWNSHGVIPPFNSIEPTGVDRSPYIANLADVVLRFASTPKRIEILKGFLQYRAALHSVGIVAGFQWLDGSFLEEAERIRNRSPKDIDVTTFWYLPDGKTQADLAASNRQLFILGEVKRMYHTDGYMVCLSLTDKKKLEFCLQQSHYWYGVWSHQRDTFRWKGFVQIDMAPQDDAVAVGILQNQETILEGNKT